MAKSNQGVMGSIKVKGYVKKDGTKVREHEREGHSTKPVNAIPKDAPDEMIARIEKENSWAPVKRGDTVLLETVEFEVIKAYPWRVMYQGGKPFLDYAKLDLVMKNWKGEIKPQRTVFLRDIDVNWGK